MTNPPQRDDELFDIVDATDHVIGQATRRQVHRDGLQHRAVHIWLFNSSDELLLQMRSPLKDEYPSTWTSSASGHVDAGESYEAAAHRELTEELGLSLALENRTKLPASLETANEFTSLWVTRSNEPPQPNHVEVEYVRWWNLEEALCSARAVPEQFSPPLRKLLAWWEAHRSG